MWIKVRSRHDFEQLMVISMPNREATPSGGTTLGPQTISATKTTRTASSSPSASPSPRPSVKIRL